MRTGFKSLHIFIIVSLTAATAARADGDPPGVLTAPVHVEASAPGDEQAAGAERALEQPAFVTVVRVDHHRDETRSTAEVLAESAGVNVRSLGGLGAFASISMRGASTGQTEILIDGVPLFVAFSSVDIGSLDLGTFDEVEVFRGGVPVALGGDALGGAVNFVTRVGPGRDGQKNEVTLGAGSFGARRARVSRGDAFDDGQLRTTFAVGYAGTTGDFDYFDDNGTPLNPTDDHIRARQNDGFDQLDVVARVATRELAAGERFSTKQQGIPGPTGVHALRASLDTTRNLIDFSDLEPGLACGDLTLAVHGYALVESQRFRDPMAEVGNVVADDSYLTLSGGAALDARYLWSAHQAWTAALDARWEHFTQRDNNRASGSPATAAQGTRFAGGISIGDELVFGGDDGEDFVVLPALRLDLATTRGQGNPNPAMGIVPPSDRNDAYVSPRVGARWRVTPIFTVKANLGRYYRAPTVIELFGDRGFVAGNGQLAPETGTSGDLGFVLAPGRHGALDRLYLEVAAFATLAHDLIVFLPTAGHYARAQNLADARTAGVEAALSARVLGAVSLTGSYTFLATEQRSPLVSTDGKALPGRPRHSLYLRGDVAHRVAAVELGVFADVTLVSGNFLDEGNLNQVPLRQLVGAGVRVAPTKGLSLTVEVRNLFDDTIDTVDSAIGPIPRAVADVLDFPLPGRAFYGAVDFNF